MVELGQSIALLSGVSILSILISTIVLWITVRIVAGRPSLTKSLFASLLLQIVEYTKNLFLPSVASTLSSAIAGGIGGFFLRPLMSWVLSILLNFLIIMFVFRLSLGQTIMVFIVRFILGIVLGLVIGMLAFGLL